MAHTIQPIDADDCEPVIDLFNHVHGKNGFSQWGRFKRSGKSGGGNLTAYGCKKFADKIAAAILQQFRVPGNISRGRICVNPGC